MIGFHPESSRIASESLDSINPPKVKAIQNYTVALLVKNLNS